MINENLKLAIRDNKLVLFVGAGASTSLKHPSWKDLVLGILDDLNMQFGDSSNLNFLNLKNSLENNSKSPLDILNIIEKDSDKGGVYKIKAKEYTHKILNEINSNHSLDSSLHKLLWEVSSKIITTNYDKILETNQPNDRSIDIFGNENLFMTLKSQKDDSKFLYKIHGDFKNPNTIVLFESDYNDIYSNSNGNEDALGDFFKNKTFLFLGFSLSDPFVNNLFTKIKNLYGNYTVGDHYIFSTKNNNDFSQFDVKQIKIDNWTESLENYLKYLIEERNKNKNITVIVDEINIGKEDNFLPPENIDSLFFLIKNKTEELRQDPSNKLLASEIHDLRSKIDQLIYGELDYLKTFDNEYKNNHLRMLFDTIYGVEKLTPQTINEINSIRTDYENHQWFERCQLISALTCSLFIFNKADEKKIAIIVDFINDNEDKVWQRALTYLVMILNHLGNKWLRFDSIKRKVKSLTLNIEVQSACQKIVEYILLFGIGKFNFSKDIFNNPYFEDNPFNYFLPFFKENNPLFDNIYDNYEGDDIEEFIIFLERSPLPDSLKYINCNTAPNKRKSAKNSNDDHRQIILNHLAINENYFPFAGYIQEFVTFIRGFHDLQHKKLIDTQLKITSTPLKDYLLSEKEKYRILGFHFHKEKSWGQAIINFEKYLELSPDDMLVLDNVANCYLYNKEVDKSKIISKKIYSISPNEKYNLIRLANIYSSEKRYEKTLDMMNKYIDIDAKNSLIHFKKSLVLLELEKFDMAMLALKEAERLDYENKSELYEVFGVMYKRLEMYDEAIEYFSKSISLDEKQSEIFSARAEAYELVENYEKAFNDIDNALKIETKDEYLLFKVLLLLNTNNLENVDILLSKVRSKNDEYYNLVANYYRLKGRYDDAFATINSLLLKSDHIKAFLGTKAAIYASLNDQENFYKYLDEVLSTGVQAKIFMNDIKLKYKNDKKFIEILEKHNQRL